jgi:hypothetical protein
MFITLRDEVKRGNLWVKDSKKYGFNVVCSKGNSFMRWPVISNTDDWGNITHEAFTTT